MKKIKVAQVCLRLTLIVIGLGQTACNLFTTREPETPTGSNAGLAWQTPTQPEIVLVNLSNAVASLNAVDYTRSFSPQPTTDNLTDVQFTFTPTPETAAQAAGLFVSWDIFSEKRFFENFRNQIAPRAAPAFLISVDERTVASQMEQQVFITYRLLAAYRLEGIDSLCEGQSQLVIKQSAQGLWYIESWRDFKKVNPFTLSELKRRFFN